MRPTFILAAAIAALAAGCATTTTVHVVWAADASRISCVVTESERRMSNTKQVRFEGLECPAHTASQWVEMPKGLKFDRSTGTHGIHQI